ncbi:hypothetical protein Q2941_39895 [Bradyrhizobium sp. UFLA05-153]
MSDWKADLAALIAETRALTRTLNDSVEQPRPQPRETVQRIGLDPIDWGGPEREEIRKRVESFKANQQRFIREREAYAASVLTRMRSGDDTKR